MLKIQRTRMAALAVALLLGGGCATSSGTNLETRGDPSEPGGLATSTTVTTPDGLRVDFAADAESFTYDRLDQLRNGSPLVIEAEVIGERYAPAQQVDTIRVEPRLLRLKVLATLKGLAPGETIEVYDANRETFSDGRRVLAVFIDASLVKGDRLIVALRPDSIAEGAYTVRSQSGFFLLGKDGSELVAYDRANPAADKAQASGLDEIRATLTE